MKSSAYLSILDDWDILKVALSTIADRVDEIVVVDGAYEWMAPFLSRDGRDPRESLPQVRDTLAAFGSKVRFVRGLWRNEMEKRCAGYEACSHRYVYRVDADEVLFFDDAALDRFFASGGAVGMMQMPIYVAPGWIRATGPDSKIEEQALLFDRERIDARRHLDYLWLVMPEDEQRQRQAPDPALIFSEPLAFNAHLTSWRTPETSISRARFYILNYFREKKRIGWAPEFRYENGGGFESLFKYVSPEQFNDILFGSDIVVGPIGLGGLGIYPSPLTPAQEDVFAHLHTELMWGLMRLNRRLADHDRTVASGTRYALDISTEAARRALGDGRSVILSCSEPVGRCEAQVVWLTSQPPFRSELKLEPLIEGKHVALRLPDGLPASLLYGTLQISVAGTSGGSLLSMRAEMRQAA